MCTSKKGWPRESASKIVKAAAFLHQMLSPAKRVCCMWQLSELLACSKAYTCCYASSSCECLPQMLPHSHWSPL